MIPVMRPRPLLACLTVAATLLPTAAGCCAGARRAGPATRPAVPMAGLSGPSVVALLDAECVPPEGWRLDRVEDTSRHAQQVWVSPTGDTAYGVIKMKLPLPVGPGLVLWGFVEEMRRSEGEGTLVEKREDPELPGLRFVAEGGRYRVHGNLTTRGFRAWAVYAGTLRARPVNAAEFEAAERAREATRVAASR